MPQCFLHRGVCSQETFFYTIITKYPSSLFWGGTLAGERCCNDCSSPQFYQTNCLSLMHYTWLAASGSVISYTLLRKTSFLSSPKEHISRIQMTCCFSRSATALTILSPVQTNNEISIKMFNSWFLMCS